MKDDFKRAGMNGDFGRKARKYDKAKARAEYKRKNTKEVEEETKPCSAPPVHPKRT